MAILGVDEVGRGPLAGPLVVGAVILPEDENGKKPGWVNQLDDSKKLSPKRRESLNKVIIENAVACGLGWVKIEELNEIGITEGLKLATRRAVEMVQKQHAKFSQIIIDGNINFLSGTKLEKYTSIVIKGDALIKEISAASIIAKVARDRYMIELSDIYPDYGFERHMGYGTKQHLAALKEFGICEEHRMFCEPVARAAGIKKISLDKKVKNTTDIGLKGEGAVCAYLEKRGHEILERNFKTRYCEIDVISIRSGRIYFTEVKTRKRGNGLDAIDLKKMEKMKFAAKVFLKYKPIYNFYDPLLAVASVNQNYRVLNWFELD
ncbi:ribonuclease HII [Candidatus Saccharibacteria bacterium]|nr:ribonuclease HII [Candidatus Saccharibacteria bacterium]